MMLASAALSSNSVEKTGPHISIKAEPLFEFLGFSVTNALLLSWLVILLLVVLAFLYSQKKGLIFQIFNLVLTGFYNFFKPIFAEKTKVFFPIIMTLFLYILFSNWSGLLPGVGTIMYYVEEGHKVPIFRGGTADLNTTFALGIVAIVLIQVFAIKYLGLKAYLKKYINLSNPINAFVGILEILSEFSKILSFSFRLFGNILAGEVLLTVVAFLVPVLASLPFLGFEIFVGFMQAFVFSMLFSIFLSVSLSSHNH